MFGETVNKSVFEKQSQHHYEKQYVKPKNPGIVQHVLVFMFCYIFLYLLTVFPHY